MTNQDSILKSRHHLANKGLNSQSHDLSNNHVWMWELYHKEDWVSKNWFFWIAVLDKTLESPLDCKEIKPVDLKGNQPWIFIGRIVAKAEAPILWPADVKSQLSLKETLMLRKIDGKRRGQQRVRWLDIKSITDSMDMNLSEFWEIVEDRKAWHATVHGVTNKLN